MKKIIFHALLLLGGAMLGSCSEDLETNAFNISEKTLQFSVDGGTQTLIIEVKCDCTLSCDADWIDYTPQYVKIGKNKLTITAAENPTLETREATILLANEELNLARTIAIRQEGIGGDRVITYTTADNNPIAIQESAFGATLLCHEYDAETRTGALAFDQAVTEIGEKAFYECSNLTSISIPNSVTEIGSYAFSGCSSLTSIKIPDSVTKIGSSAFYDCSSLRAFNGKYASSDKRCLIVEGVLVAFAPAEITSYTIPNSVTTIGESIFYECSSLTSITIPNSVTTIGGWAFCECTSLTSVTIGNSVTEIGSYAFSWCSSLTSITIPNSVTTIGGWAFCECTSLTSVTIGNRVTEIGSYAFSRCSSLTSITIPNSVTEIGSSAFSGCSSLRAFNGKYASSDKRCLIVEGVLVAFAPAELTSYTIPNSITEIGREAFKDCKSLTSITIGNSVTEIGNWAFYDCSSLTSIYCKPQTPPILGSYVFYDIVIYVPMASVEAYKESSYWKDYASMIVGYDF